MTTRTYFLRSVRVSYAWSNNIIIYTLARPLLYNKLRFLKTCIFKLAQNNNIVSVVLIAFLLKQIQ